MHSTYSLRKMPEQDKKILGFRGKLALGLAGFLIILPLFFWQTIRGDLIFSIALLIAILLAGVLYWFWRNYRLLSDDPELQVMIKEKLEGILHNIFLPRGYDITTLPSVDKANIGWAFLRDPHGISVIVQYLERPLEESVGLEQITLMDERMEEESAPKGICLTTSSFNSEALGFARRKNILTKNSDQLIALLKEAEKESQKVEEYHCRYCGSKLEQSEGITDYMKCPNPDCSRTFTMKELEEQKDVRSGRTNTFTVSCYGCSRSVELDTTMNGLMECPYDDCSWIINVDNEILALQGGLDKRASERLAEIVCPKCRKLIKVPSDAEGLIECPCEEKWIIDVGAALGERAQAQHASSGGRAHGGEEEMSPERKSQTREAESAVGPGVEEEMLDCPGCGAGVPAHLENCPVCGTNFKDRNAGNQSSQTTGQGDEIVEVAAAEHPGQVTHRHTYLTVSTPGLFIFFIVSISAFLTFVYFLTQ